MTFRGGTRRHSPSPIGVEFWVDADHAGDHDDHKSRTGLIVKVNGDTTTCISRKQKACTNSTCWAETKAIATMARKLECFRTILHFLGHPHKGPITGWSDSAAAIALQKRGHVKHSMTHLRCDFQNVQDPIRNRQLRLRHISGKLNPADLLTKPLPFIAHTRYTKFMLGCRPQLPITGSCRIIIIILLTIYLYISPLYTT